MTKRFYHGLNVTFSCLNKIYTLFFLKRMSVRKSHRGTGLAQQLIQKVVEHASKPLFERTSARFVVLAATEYQQPAIKFYKKTGFKTLKVLRQPFFGGLSYNYWCAALRIPVDAEAAQDSKAQPSRLVNTFWTDGSFEHQSISSR